MAEAGGREVHGAAQVQGPDHPRGRQIELSADELGEAGVLRITSIGQDPWLFRELSGKISFHRADAAQLKVTALDLNGYPLREIGSARDFQLLPGAPYYLISK